MVNLPKDIPAELFWSVTLYEAENASGLDNGQPFPSKGKLDNHAKSVDGSTDLYIGPKALRVKRLTGWPRRPVEAFSQSSGSMHHRSPLSTEAGSRVMSRRSDRLISREQPMNENSIGCSV
jgi:hypothetical protein